MLQICPKHKYLWFSAKTEWMNECLDFSVYSSCAVCSDWLSVLVKWNITQLSYTQQLWLMMLMMLVDDDDGVSWCVTDESSLTLCHASLNNTRHCAVSLTRHTVPIPHRRNRHTASGRPSQYAPTICPAPCKLTFDLLTVKVVSESRVTWAISVPILVFQGLSVLDLGPLYVTDRQTSDSIIA